MDLLNAIANSTIEEKILLLPQALEHGELGIDFLIDILKDPCLEIRAKAYELLQSVEIDKAKKAIASGLLFNPGDKIYSVYQSTMRFTDDGYYLGDLVYHLENLTLLIHAEESFSLLEEAELYQSKRLYCCLNREEAEQKAETIHRELIQDKYFGRLGFEWEQKNTDLSVQKWLINNLNDFQCNFNTWEDEQKTLKYLHLPENIELLSKFWHDGIGSFAVMEEEYIQQQVSIRIEEKLTQRTVRENIESELIARPKSYQKKYFKSLVWAWNNIDDIKIKIKLLPEFLRCGELGIDFLIECLEDSELQIRVATYEVLQNVETDKAQQAIASGVLLNPGDIIYSVYLSAMWFTDSSYLLFDYVDESKSFRQEIYGKPNYKDEGGLDDCESRRLFCYADLERAEQKAENIHQKIAKENTASFFGFDWQKENPNFDVKQWCIEHNFIPKQKWNDSSSFQVEWEIISLTQELNNPGLLDKFKRSKYIYHPDLMDTWCRDNDVFYDRNASNWKNSMRILDLLNLPKNVELLSKFYKDGVGSFAFVREEIVQQKINVHIAKELSTIEDRENSRLDLIVIPKKYSRKTIDWLVSVLEKENTKPEQRLKARQFLQSIDSEYIPF